MNSFLFNKKIKEASFLDLIYVPLIHSLESWACGRRSFARRPSAEALRTPRVEKRWVHERNEAYDWQRRRRWACPGEWPTAAEKGQFQPKQSEKKKRAGRSPLRQILRRRKTRGVTSRAAFDSVTLTLKVTSISAEARPEQGSDSRNVCIRVGTTPTREMFNLGDCNAAVLDTLTSSAYGSCDFEDKTKQPRIEANFFKHNNQFSWCKSGPKSRRIHLLSLVNLEPTEKKARRSWFCLTAYLVRALLLFWRHGSALMGRRLAALSQLKTWPENGPETVSSLSHCRSEQIDIWKCFGSLDRASNGSSGGGPSLTPGLGPLTGPLEYSNESKGHNWGREIWPYDESIRGVDEPIPWKTGETTASWSLFSVVGPQWINIW